MGSDPKDGPQGEGVEAVFAEFVRNANELGMSGQTIRTVAPSVRELALSAGERSRQRSRGTPTPVTENFGEAQTEPAERISRERVAQSHKRGAADRSGLFPDPSSVEHGLGVEHDETQMKASELDAVLAEMDALMRSGHVVAVRQKLETLCHRYPEDLLLLRRVAELYLDHRLLGLAIGVLFTLAARQFEARDVTGMRHTLEQVLVLDPKNRRAYRLLGLLDRRPATGTGR